MKLNDAITKLRVMLGAETEVAEVIATETKLEDEIKEEVEVKMAEATLVDGTEVYTEGELAAGAILYVKVEEGEAPFAPEGMHETTEGMLITVGENGEIISIEEKAPEAPAEEVIEEEMEEEKEKEAFDAEGLIEAIAEMIKPQAEELAALKEKLETLSTRFEAVADEPAAKPVKNTFSQQAETAKSIAEARFERLVALRKGK